MDGAAAAQRILDAGRPRLHLGQQGEEAAVAGTREVAVPVIFVTAFPDRLLTGQKTEPAFLVTKPFEPEVLKITIAQALNSRREAERQRAMG